ncbi:MAG: outer membrane beta-barrel family protein [Bacteroidota bacterium]
MKSIVLFVFLVIAGSVSAQSFSIDGSIVNKSGHPLPGANIKLLSDPGQIVVMVTTSGPEGAFVMKATTPGNFILKISFVGFNDILKPLTINQNLSLEKMVMTRKTIVMPDAVITGKAPTAVVKGDTTEISAQAYKVNPDATSEELVTKMPGVTNDNGTIKAQGEEIKKVLVDGKQFFGDDPTTVLRNLPAEVIDKVQIFDKKSDQSEFTGFDDGNTTKTMNIVTRQSYRNGSFGKGFAGGGIKDNSNTGETNEDVWKAGGTYNIFKGDTRFSIIGQSNNINDQNFSTDDFLGTTGGGSNGGRSFNSRGTGGPQGGGPLSSFLVNPTNGVTTTNALGLNFSNKGKKLDFSGSYFLNYTDNTNLKNLTRQYFTQANVGLNYHEITSATINNSNQRANFRLEYQIDSMNSILFQPKISLQHTLNNSGQLGQNIADTVILSNTNNTSGNTTDGINFSAPILLKHKFTKTGRTISLNLNPSYNDSKGNSTLNTNSNFYSDTLTTSDTVNQIGNSTKNTKSLNSNLTYTEPLSKNSQLQLNYGTNLSNSSSDKKIKTLLLPTVLTVLDTSLSNVFQTNYQLQTGGISLRKKTDKLNLLIGVSYQQTDLRNKQTYPEVYTLDRTYYSVLPNAMLQIRFTKQKSLRINYNTNYNIPNVDQLQSVINNNNPLQLSTGNPDLKPEYQNSLNFRYSTSNTEKLSSFFIFLNSSYTFNTIGNSSMIATKDTLVNGDIKLGKGSQLTRPVNLDQAYTMRCFANYSFQLGFMKSKLNLNSSITYSSTPGEINGLINTSDVLASGFGFVLSSNISEKIDFTLSSSSTYNKNVNTIQTESNSNYFQQNSRARINIMPWKGLVLQTDANDIYYSAFNATPSEQYLLWNAALAWKFLAKKQAEFRFSVYDILGQNKSISRNYTDTYYENATNNVMQRYYMLTFSYTIQPLNQQNFKKDRGQEMDFRPPHND